MTNSHLQANPVSLFFALSLVLIAIFISYREKIGLEKEIIIATVRMIIQLVIVAYILEFIFKLDIYWLTLAMVLVIIINAALNAGHRGKGLKAPILYAFIALLITTTITLTILVLSGSIKFIPAQIIPISGMIVGSSMSSIGLAFSNLFQLFKDQEQAVLEMLALGATPYQASRNVIKLTIKNGLQPTIDGIKATGIVTLPGMMSGLIMAGVDPLKSIIYQIVIMFMMMSGASLSTFIATYLAYRSFFTQKYQLNNKLRS